MSARKPLEDACTGGLFCPVRGHVSVGLGARPNVISHIPLTLGQTKALRERRYAAREAVAS